VVAVTCFVRGKIKGRRKGKRNPRIRLKEDSCIKKLVGTLFSNRSLLWSRKLIILLTKLRPLNYFSGACIRTSGSRSNKPPKAGLYIPGVDRAVSEIEWTCS
jgi:hypothetical protein